MIRLTVLGQIDLRDGKGREVTEVLRQPRRLALLAYLAGTHPGAVVRRDRLLSLLWRDLPGDGARNALRQALHKLRTALGAEVLAARGTDSLLLDASHVECDLWAFRAALRMGRLSDALDLYRGPLLPDFVAPDAPAFNDWLDTQRIEVRRSAARAAWALAEQRERARQVEEAGTAARRAIELLEDDEPALRQLILLLERLNDSAGAVCAYQAYEERIRDRLGIEPSHETRSLILRIRAGSGAHSDAASPAVRASLSQARIRVAVHGFDNLSGSAEHDFVARLIAAACRAALQDLRLADVVDAGEATPTLAVRGEYHLADGHWRARAFVQVIADTRAIGGTAHAEAPHDRPWEVAACIASRVAAVVAAHVEPRVASWAPAVHEPPSVEAHELHLRGMEAHLRGDFRAAIASFVRAASLQDNFALPLLWAVQAGLNLEDYELAAALHETVLGHRTRLSRAERLGCDYHGALLAGDRGTAFRVLQSVAELLPDSEVLAQLGREAMFINRPRLAADTMARLGSTRGWIPEWTPYWRRLTEAQHMIGDHAVELDTAERGRAQHPESVGVLLCVARAHAALGDAPATYAATEAAVAMGRDRFTSAADVAHAAGVELCAHGARDAGLGLLRRAVELQRADLEGIESTCRARMRLAQMLYDAGEFEQSAAVLDACRDEEVDIEVAGLEGRLHARADRREAAVAAAESLQRTRRRFAFGRQLLEGARIAAVLGNAGQAVTLLRMAFARGLPYGVELHADGDLALVAADARFRELMRPKG